MLLYIRSIEESERVEIESGMRTDNAVWARRCQILWHSSRGKKANETAEILNGFPGSVRVILRTFNRDGLDALRPRKRPGPTPLVKRLSEETLNPLKDLAHQSPRNYGVDRAVYAVDHIPTIEEIRHAVDDYFDRWPSHVSGWAMSCSSVMKP